MSWLHETRFGTKEFERHREEWEKEHPMKDSAPMNEERYKLIERPIDETATELRPNVIYILRMMELLASWKAEGKQA